MRLILVKAELENAKIEQLDVKTAYFDSDMGEVYMSLPKRYGSEDKVCKLQKSIYGLPTTSRKWQRLLEETLLKRKLKKLNYAESTYERVDGTRKIILIHNIDDFIMSSQDGNLIRRAKEELKRFFLKYPILNTGIVPGHRIIEKGRKAPPEPEVIYQRHVEISQHGRF